MLNVIMRLGLPGNSTLENRILAVDIASTLFYWDQRAAQEVAHVHRRSYETDQITLPLDDNHQNADGEHHSRCVHRDSCRLVCAGLQDALTDE